MNSPRLFCQICQVLAFGDGVNTVWFGQGAHLVQYGSDLGELEDLEDLEDLEENRWQYDHYATMRVDMGAQNLKIA